MVDITKVSPPSRVTTPQMGVKSADNQWAGQIKAPPPSSQDSVKSMQVALERAPQNVTNQNAGLTPRQMAEHLSRELTKRTAQNKATKGKDRRDISQINHDLSSILDENKDISSLLDSGSPSDIAAFLAYFQSAMEKHLKGFEFGEIIYDQELINSIMAKY